MYANATPMALPAAALAPVSSVTVPAGANPTDLLAPAFQNALSSLPSGAIKQTMVPAPGGQGTVEAYVTPWGTFQVKFEDSIAKIYKIGEGSEAMTTMLSNHISATAGTQAMTGTTMMSAQAAITPTSLLTPAMLQKIASYPPEAVTHHHVVAAGGASQDVWITPGGTITVDIAAGGVAHVSEITASGVVAHYGGVVGSTYGPLPVDAAAAAGSAAPATGGYDTTMASATGTQMGNGGYGTTMASAPSTGNPIVGGDGTNMAAVAPVNPPEPWSGNALGATQAAPTSGSSGYGGVENMTLEGLHAAVSGHGCHAGHSHSHHSGSLHHHQHHEHGFSHHSHEFEFHANLINHSAHHAHHGEGHATGIFFDGHGAIGASAPGTYGTQVPMNGPEAIPDATFSGADLMGMAYGNGAV